MDAFTLAAKLTLDSGDFERDLGKQEGVFKQFGNKLGGAISTVGKVGAAAIGAAATAVGALTKNAVESYADYEQLVGGVETLFGIGGKSLQQFAKESGRTAVKALNDYRKVTQGQRTVLQNAQKAYKTAGLSMNQYMETVTSFSASLIQSLGGDQAKAAKVADQAIIDMSDNANKMGTSMEAIQNAYQGFAKQNYTMLDNLKLGYGGTKTEMERLIADANKVKQANGEMADLSIERFSDVVEAIHIIQTEMGITGTTAAEAEHTISGSINAMKASWQNLLVAIALGNKDFGTYVDQLVDTATIAFDNIMPVVEKALTGIASFVEKIAPIVAEKLPGMISDVLPKLLNAAGSILEGVINALPALFTTLFEAVGNIDWLSLGTSVWNTIKGAFEGIAGWFSKKFTAAKEAITGIKWGEVSSYIDNAITGAGSALSNIVANITKFFTDSKTAIEEIKWESTGKAIWNWIKNAFTTVGGWFGERFETARTAIEKIEWGTLGTQIWEWIKAAFTAVGSTLKGFFDDAVTKIQSIEWATVGTQIWDSIKAAFATASEWLGKRFKDAKTAIEKVEWSTLGTKIWGQITIAFSTAGDWLKKKFEDGKKKIEELGWGETGTTIADKVNGTVGIVSAYLQSAFEIGKTLIEAIPWDSIGTWISNKVSTKSTLISNTLKLAFGMGKSLIEAIPWADIGTTINDLINTTLPLIGPTLEAAFNAGKTLVEGIGWADIGSTINTLLDGKNLAAVKSTIEAAFKGGKTLVESIKWNEVGSTITTLVKTGIEGLGGVLQAAASAGLELMKSVGWADLGKSIVDLIGQGISPIIIPVYQKLMGWVDSTVGPTEVKSGNAEATVTSQGVDITNTDTGKTAHFDAKPNNLFRNNEGVAQGLQNLVKDLFGVGQNSHSGKFASALHGGKILHGATLFGFNDNGPMIGGEAGTEAIVGVNSLDQMIQNSVSKAVGKMPTAADMAAAIKGLQIQVVLDTGELVGAIGGKMDAELGKIGDWKGGGRA